MRLDSAVPRTGYSSLLFPLLLLVATCLFLVFLSTAIRRLFPHLLGRFDVRRGGLPSRSVREVILNYTMGDLVDSTVRAASQMTVVSHENISSWSAARYEVRRDEREMDRLDGLLGARMRMNDKVDREDWGVYRPMSAQRATARALLVDGQIGRGDVDNEADIDISVSKELNNPAERLIHNHSVPFYHGTWHASNTGSSRPDFVYKYHQDHPAIAPGEEMMVYVESKVYGALIGVLQCVYLMARSSFSIVVVNKNNRDLARTRLENANIDADWAFLREMTSAQRHNLEDRALRVLTQVINEFHSGRAKHVLVHDRRHYALFRLQDNVLRISPVLTNTGPLFSIGPQADTPSRRLVAKLVGKPFGLWIALMLDRQERALRRRAGARPKAAVPRVDLPSLRPLHHHTEALLQAEEAEVDIEEEERGAGEMEIGMIELKNTWRVPFRPLEGLIESIDTELVPTDALAEGEEEEAGNSSLETIDHNPLFDPLPQQEDDSESGWGTSTTASSFASMQDEKMGMGWPDDVPAKLDVLIPPPRSSRSLEAFGFTAPIISRYPFATLLLSHTIGPETLYPSPPSSYLPSPSKSCANKTTLVIEDYIASGRIWDCYSARLYRPISPGSRDVHFIPVVVKLSSASPAYRRPPFHPLIAWDDLIASSDKEDSLYRGTALRSLSSPLDGEARVVPRYLGLYEGSFRAETESGPQCPVRIMVMENMGPEISLDELRLYRDAILFAYSTLHSRRILHNDVQPRHWRIRHTAISNKDDGDGKRRGGSEESASTAVLLDFSGSIDLSVASESVTEEERQAYEDESRSVRRWLD